LVMRQNHILDFLCVYFQTNFLLAYNWACVFFMVFMFSPNILTSSVQTKSCVPFNSSPFWWHSLRQSSKAMIKHLFVSDYLKRKYDRWLPMQTLL
jgi:hypothetical protein